MKILIYKCIDSNEDKTILVPTIMESSNLIIKELYTGYKEVELFGLSAGAVGTTSPKNFKTLFPPSSKIEDIFKKINEIFKNRFSYELISATELTDWETKVKK